MRPRIEKDIDRAVERLTAADPLFSDLMDQYGIPPAMSRPPGFPTLLLIILEQQVSLASARAVYDKLNTANSILSPETFLQWKDEELLSFGYSRQKRRYTRLLANALIDGSFSFEWLGELDDGRAREYLMQLKGIGSWTADVYLMMAEGRADFFPAGDIALQVSYQEQMGLTERPGTGDLTRIAEAWRPERSLAARWLWHAYLTERGRSA